MNKYPWETQYRDAMQQSAFYASTGSLKRSTAAENKIYDRLEDYLQGRQSLNSDEWHAIKHALSSLDDFKHEISAQDLGRPLI